jgi:hypothetical protein
VLGNAPWLPYLMQAKGLGARRRRRKVDRAGNQREAQKTSPARTWH